MAFLEAVSKVGLASAVITLVAFLFHVIGFAAPYWVGNGDDNRGIWIHCNPVCSSYPGDHPPWLKATQAMETLAFLVLLGCVVLLGLRLTVMKFENSLMRLIIMIFQFTSAFFIWLGIIIYPSMADNFDRYEFAIFFEIIAACLTLIAGTLGILDWRKVRAII